MKAQVLHQLDLGTKAAQTTSQGRNAVALVDASLGPTEVRARDHRGAALEQRVKERERGAQAKVVADLEDTVDLGDGRVEVDPYEDPLTSETPPSIDRRQF
jgi:hypothetical protein